MANSEDPDEMPQQSLLCATESALFAKNKIDIQI